MARSRRRDDDDDDDDDTPRKKSRRRDDDDDEDEDEDEDTPRRKKSRSIADDDDDDGDDRPRKKRKTLNRSKKSAGGGGPLLLILGLIGGFVLLAGGGFAVWFFVFNDTPEKAFADVKDATSKKDYGRVYDRLDKRGQAEFDNMPPNPFLKSSQSGKKGRELYIEVRKEIEGIVVAFGLGNRMAEDEKRYREAKVEKVTVDGDNATLTAGVPDGSTIIISMVKQDGRWRMRTDPGGVQRR